MSADRAVHDTSRPVPGSQPVNEVRLRGRVAVPAVARTLPSGDRLVTARLIIDRDQEARRRSAQRVDVIECIAWTRRTQRSVLSWTPGDVVEIAGAIRRRFYRDGGSPISRFEVEIRAARRHLRRGGTSGADPAAARAIPASSVSVPAQTSSK
jgi:single-strand DNA-binding protein